MSSSINISKFKLFFYAPKKLNRGNLGNYHILFKFFYLYIYILYIFLIVNKILRLHTNSDGHRNSMTESAQWGRFSEKCNIQVDSKCIIYPPGKYETIRLVLKFSIISKSTSSLLKLDLHCNWPNFRHVSNASGSQGCSTNTCVTH